MGEEHTFTFHSPARGPETVEGVRPDNVNILPPEDWSHPLVAEVLGKAEERYGKCAGCGCDGLNCAGLPQCFGYVTKDSGVREDYATGSRRDTQDGKTRYDLIPVHALTRWADLMARGAEKYGERNWEKGQPMSRAEASALRHLYQYLSGDGVEDHLAAVLFNVGLLIDHEERIARSELPAELDDRRHN